MPLSRQASNPRREGPCSRPPPPAAPRRDSTSASLERPVELRGFLRVHAEDIVEVVGGHFLERDPAAVLPLGEVEQPLRGRGNLSRAAAARVLADDVVEVDVESVGNGHRFCYLCIHERRKTGNGSRIFYLRVVRAEEVRDYLHQVGIDIPLDSIEMRAIPTSTRSESIFPWILSRTCTANPASEIHDEGRETEAGFLSRPKGITRPPLL